MTHSGALQPHITACADALGLTMAHCAPHQWDPKLPGLCGPEGGEGAHVRWDLPWSLWALWALCGACSPHHSCSMHDAVQYPRPMCSQGAKPSPPTQSQGQTEDVRPCTLSSVPWDRAGDILLLRCQSSAGPSPPPCPTRDVASGCPKARLSSLGRLFPAWTLFSPSQIGCQSNPACLGQCWGGGCMGEGV